MAVTVAMRVKVPDWERFSSAYAEMVAGQAPGFHGSRLLRRDGDPMEVLVLELWDSHEAFNAFAEKVGEDFNRRAGTEGAEWDDSVWVDSGVGAGAAPA